MVLDNLEVVENTSPPKTPVDNSFNLVEKGTPRTCKNIIKLGNELAAAAVNFTPFQEKFQFSFKGIKEKVLEGKVHLADKQIAEEEKKKQAALKKSRRGRLHAGGALHTRDAKRHAVRLQDNRLAEAHKIVQRQEKKVALQAKKKREKAELQARQAVRAATKAAREAAAATKRAENSARQQQTQNLPVSQVLTNGSNLTWGWELRAGERNEVALFGGRFGQAVEHHDGVQE
ncbi:MAG: hypothetical protein M1829_002682 [Trizodia sp. TS-e1964]|nr:MAG: hypothetical protein M1829_002682 [Trizodia sp. TS-e1964]